MCLNLENFSRTAISHLDDPPSSRKLPINLHYGMPRKRDRGAERRIG